LVVVWEASDRICGKRLRPLLPILVDAMEQHGHLQLVPEVRSRLLAISAATIDRALRDIRQQAGTAKRRRSPPSAAIRRVDVETGHAGAAEKIEQPTADDRADDAEQNVDDCALARGADDLARNQARP
jgi:hypothetical protein